MTRFQSNAVTSSSTLLLLSTLDTGITWFVPNLYFSLSLTVYGDYTPSAQTHTFTVDSCIFVVRTVVEIVTVVRTVCKVGLQASAQHVVQDDRAYTFTVPCKLVRSGTATRVTKLTTYHLCVRVCVCVCVCVQAVTSIKIMMILTKSHTHNTFTQ